jgi:lipopolysaccharide/colanic/teichoic acid biosynthesis glycosyltransferase
VTALFQDFDAGYAEQFPPLARRPRDVFLRVAESCLAAILLCVLLPVLLVLAAAVVVDSRGGIFYRQLRVGAGGRLFTICKFRSMRAGAAGPHVTLGDDARVTRVGQILRKTSLDELPQLWNVISGQMSLVGPRPETPGLARRYPQPCREIFRYRPGLTGPGQLRFRDHDLVPPPGVDAEDWYLTVVVPAKVACDLDYLQKFTLRRWLATLRDTVIHLSTSTVRNRKIS